jgi:hypothetical protein
MLLGAGEDPERDALFSGQQEPVPGGAGGEVAPLALRGPNRMRLGFV